MYITSLGGPVPCRRWQGKRLVDLFTQEFPVLSRSYYERAAASGRLRIEAPSKGRNAGQAPPNDTPLSSGMCVRHLVHRHEPPVLAGKVEVSVSQARLNGLGEGRHCLARGDARRLQGKRPKGVRPQDHKWEDYRGLGGWRHV
eukprot:1040059-Pelagomonas_calceolata.AAC.11